MKERGEAGGEKGGRSRPKEDSLSVNVSDMLSTTSKSDTRKSVAQEAKVPERKLRGIAAIAKAAPEMLPMIERGELKISDAVREVRRILATTQQDLLQAHQQA